MRGIQRPLIIYTSQKPFYDRCAEDMKCGDLDEKTLKERFGLLQISERVNCYTFQKLAIPAYGDMPFLSKDQAAGILFDQLRFEAGRFAFWGPYTGIIQRLFTHMQYGNGKDFYDVQMNQAYKRMIEGDNSFTSTINSIKRTLHTFSGWEEGLQARHFANEMRNAHLPKFNRFSDRINGMGISVHEINSTQILLESLKFDSKRYTAVIHLKGQDHFGLDMDDISKTKFKYWKIFKIWFVLQRFQKLAYKPFFTNMEARITITGEANA
ncbi:DUF3289 family protein [Franconibacter helveticus]|uniref:DUF3289 family protein n=1 Tax=Franconibacter helveticus TaxID=357240 RepID=UPI00066AF281|nr:DUF3289 family protein [Franconibacter helveticus]